MIRPPSYEGRGLVNLVAEIERRLTGTSPSPGTDRELSRLIPDADTYVLVLFDGLGDHQLAHRSAAPLLADRMASLDAPFPTTTAVSLATVATGLAPRSHGIVGYHMWFEGVSSPVNVLKWTTPWGDPVPFHVESVLPAPNLWERLSQAGREPVTVQPGSFAGSPLSRMLYRGCRFEQAWSEAEIAEATIDLATRPGRMVFTYVPYVDVAAHMEGQDSHAYEQALAAAGRIWRQIASRLP
ncbi:MAG TPA: alkaline phosphatase family protein, partial [Acidimicrobiia bacterium]